MIIKRKYPWFAEQTWRNIFFFHWPVSPNSLERYIPKPLQLDLFAGKAWVTVVVFFATDSRFRYLPKGTNLPPITQINFRTYVSPRISEEKGVFFLSIRLAHLLGALGGKSIFNLPFQYADVSMYHDASTVKISSNKSEKNLLNVHYKSKKELTNNQLAPFLIERYCIWNVKGKQMIKIP